MAPFSLTQLRPSVQFAFPKSLEPFFARPDVSDVMVNQDGRVWIDTHSEGMLEVASLAPSETLAFLNAIAHEYRTVINKDSPTLQATLSDGTRIQGAVPPAAPGPALVARRPARVLYDLDSYVHGRRMTPSIRAALRLAVRDRSNVLVTGGTGTGKTTFLNALLQEVSVVTPQHRVVTIEDTRELQSPLPNTLVKLTSCDRPPQQVVREALRENPHRVVFGEMRGPEALDVLDAWNTGHPGGFATVHANSAAAALDRVRRLASRGVNGELELREVAEAIDVIVYLKRMTAPGSDAAVPGVAGFLRVRATDNTTSNIQLDPLQ